MSDSDENYAAQIDDSLSDSSLDDPPPPEVVEQPKPIVKKKRVQSPAQKAALEKGRATALANRLARKKEKEDALNLKKKEEKKPKEPEPEPEPVAPPKKIKKPKKVRGRRGDPSGPHGALNEKVLGPPLIIRGRECLAGRKHLLRARTRRTQPPFSAPKPRRRTRSAASLCGDGQVLDVHAHHRAQQPDNPAPRRV